MTIKPHPLLVSSYYKLISYDKVRFIVVGGTGFIVNYLSLALFFDLLNLPIVVAQILGAEIAILATFAGNSLWTFKNHSHHSFVHKIVKFHLSAFMGAAVNSAIVVVLVHFGHIYYGLALVCGSAAGLVWNYTLYKRFVFKMPPARDDEI